MIRTLTLLITMCLLGCIEQSSPVIDERKIQLTTEEQRYVSSHRVVTWAQEDNRPPFIYKEKNIIKGISVEYLNLISKKTGLIFKIEPVLTFTAGLDAVKNNQIDLITAIRPSTEMAKYLGFSSPYAYTAGVFVFRINSQPRSPLRAGISNGDPAFNYLLERFPDIHIIKTEDTEEAISLLEKGLLDVAVMSESSADFLTNKSIIKMRKASTDFDYPYSFGFKKENIILGQILSKAVSSITKEEKKKINEIWEKE